MVAQYYIVGKDGLVKHNPSAVGSDHSLDGNDSYCTVDLNFVKVLDNGTRVVTGGRYLEFWDIFNSQKVNADTVEYPTAFEEYPNTTFVLAAANEVCRNCLFLPVEHRP